MSLRNLLVRSDLTGCPIPSPLCLYCESGAGGGHGEHEGGDAKGGVDRHEAGAERGSGALAAEQQQDWGWALRDPKERLCGTFVRHDDGFFIKRNI